MHQRIINWMSVVSETLHFPPVSQVMPHFITALREFFSRSANQGEFVGDGREKVVRRHPGDKTKVIAEIRPELVSSHESALGQFELAKLLHILFPNNFPKVFYVKKPAKFCVEYVEQQPMAEPISLKDANDFYLTMRSLGINIDSAGSNFIPRGDAYVYVDLINPWSVDGHPVYSFTDLLNKILELEDESKRIVALKSLERMEKLRRKFVKQREQKIPK